MDEGYILQEMGSIDRRERRLHVTDKGAKLARRLLELQTRRLGDALAMTGPGGERAAAAFLAGVIAADDHDRASALVGRVMSAPEDGVEGV